MSQSAHEWTETVLRLEQLGNEAAAITGTALREFESHLDTDDWVLVDRVLLIASRVRDELRKTYHDTNDQHKRRLVAIALFELGDTSVTETLLEAVEKDSDIYLIAASKLANKSVQKAVKPMMNRLSIEWRRAEPPAILTLLIALQKLTTQLPVALYKNLTSHKSPEIRVEASKFRQAPD
jgi:hypothetical protein